MVLNLFLVNLFSDNFNLLIVAWQSELKYPLNYLKLLKIGLKNPHVDSNKEY